MLQILLISWLNFFHPFYVSVTEITFNPKSQSMEISCRMFNDDLEKTIDSHYHIKIDIVKPTDKGKVNLLIADYIKKHLLIKVDGKPVEMNYVGYEIQEDGAWGYLEVKGISSAKRVDVHNDLLYTEHTEQSNMIHVIVKGERKSTKLDNPDADASFSF